MAASNQAKQKDQTVPASKAKAGAEKANAEAQARSDEETAKGYRGVATDELPNSAYSLESGPDSPGVAEAAEAVAKARQASSTQGKQ